MLLYRPWSVFTYMFTHIDFWHIFWNMFMLFVFGKIMMTFLGPRKLLSMYLLGGLAGFLLYIIAFNIFPALDVNSTIVGASAAIMAIVVAMAAYMPNYTLNLILIGPVKLQYIAMFYVVLDFVSIRMMENTGGHIGHLGGAVYGFVWGWNYRLGRDYSSWFELLLDRFFNLFKRGRGRFKVVKKAGTRVPKSDEDYNADKLKRQQRVDAILDKISKAGYDSLSKEEKDFLFKHSKS
jgi:membrane associated rhomboid family serine protease